MSSVIRHLDYMQYVLICLSSGLDPGKQVNILNFGNMYCLITTHNLGDTPSTPVIVGCSFLAHEYFTNSIV